MLAAAVEFDYCVRCKLLLCLVQAVAAAESEGYCEGLLQYCFVYATVASASCSLNLQVRQLGAAAVICFNFFLPNLRYHC